MVAVDQVRVDLLGDDHLVKLAGGGVVALTVLFDVFTKRF